MGGSTFRYPEGWYAAEFFQHSRGPTWFGPSLSNRSMSDPCHRPRPTLIICDSAPVESLSGGDAVAQWTVGPAWGGIEDASGWTTWAPTGYLAQAGVVPATGDCRDLGGTKEVTVSVTRAPHERVYRLAGCTSGADAGQWVVRIAQSLRIADG